MSKVYDTQDYLTIELTYYNENDAEKGLEDISDDIVSAVIKYEVGTSSGEWAATVDKVNKTISYSLPVGSPLAIPGRWTVWAESAMVGGGVIQSTPFKFVVFEEGT